MNENMNIFTEIKKNSEDGNVSSIAVNRLESLMGISREEAMLMVRYISKTKGNRGVPLDEVLQFSSGLNCSERKVQEMLVRLSCLGTFEFPPLRSCDHEFALRIPKNLWYALNSDNESMVRLYQSHLTPQYREMLALYCSAMFFCSGFTTLNEWEEISQVFVTQADNQLARRIQALQLDSFTQSVFVLAGIIGLLCPDKIELEHLVKLFSLNLFDQARLLAEWKDVDTGLESSGLFKFEQDFESSHVVTCTIPLKYMFQSEVISESQDFKGTIPSMLEEIKVSDIPNKRLIYNADFRRQCDTLFHLLSPSVFADYARQMDADGSPRGIPILLSGLPGTGKTELVRQLARASGRNLLLFDVSQQRIKWWGESEKRMKVVFDYYAKRSKDPQKAPILLFNEADSVFGTRSHNGHDVGITQNAIQTILLNEMERFNGIMICTTNLPEILDSAYSRRFLYRLNIEMPDESTRAELLGHYFPELEESTCHYLAETFTFSAAQLTNFIRRQKIDRLVHADVGRTTSELVAFLTEEARTTLPITRPGPNL